MRFVILCSSDNENYNADCDVAVIDITPDLAKLILARRKTFLEQQKKEKSLTEHRYYDVSASYYEVGELPDIDDEPRAMEELPKGWNEQRTECDVMVLCDLWMWWQCHPKHSNITVTTAPIYYDWLEKQIKPNIET